MAQSAAWLSAAALPLRAQAETKDRVTVSIFHTTDLHGHIVPTQTYDGVQDVGGLARCITCIRQWRKEVPHSLLVDLGDVYQGTQESLQNRGNLMMDLFSRLGYDAWTLGNHDFDWGREALEKNLALSSPPILTANLTVDGAKPGNLEGAWKKVSPWMMKEVAGFRIALIGLITPGLPYWLTPETLAGTAVTDPVAALQRSIAEAKSAKADAIVVMGHMGWVSRDDFGNPVRHLLRACPEVDVYLAGHSHKDKPLWNVGRVVCSQANYYGIHCGRADLVFDRYTRKLIDRRVSTTLMDRRFELDASVIDAAEPDLKKAAAQLARVIGKARHTVSSKEPDSPLGRLLCEAFAHALTRNRTPVDGVFHGTFGSDLEQGDITVADCWRILPYENTLVTAEFGTGDLLALMREDRDESKWSKFAHTLWPFTLEKDDRGKIVGLSRDGKPVASAARFRIAFNSYDSQSGGQKLELLHKLITRPSAKRSVTPIDTRGALIEYISEKGEV